MNQLRNAVMESIQTEMKKKTEPVRGYIPQGQIDTKTWTCTVRIPNPDGGTHPGKGGKPTYLEYQDVQVPHTGPAFLQAIFNLVSRRDRAVTVGFRGGNIAHPYVINFLSFLTEQTDREEGNVRNRAPITDQRFTAAGSAVGTPMATAASRRNLSASASARSSLEVPRSATGTTQQKVTQRMLESAPTAQDLLNKTLNRETTVRVTPRP